MIDLDSFDFEEIIDYYPETDTIEEFVMITMKHFHKSNINDACLVLRVLEDANILVRIADGKNEYYYKDLRED